MRGAHGWITFLGIEISSWCVCLRFSISWRWVIHHTEQTLSSLQLTQVKLEENQDRCFPLLVASS